MERQSPQGHRPGLNRLRALWAEGRCALDLGQHPI